MGTKKKPFTILEALISMMIVLIALVPLIAPYTMIFQEEKRILEELEADRVAQLLFVDTLAKLLRNEISLPPYAKGEVVSVDNRYSELLTYNIFEVWQEVEHYYTVTFIFEPKRAAKGHSSIEIQYIVSGDFLNETG